MPRSTSPYVSRPLSSSPYPSQAVPTRHSQRLASRRSAPSTPTPAPSIASPRGPDAGIRDGGSTLQPSGITRHRVRASSPPSRRKNVQNALGQGKASQPSSSTSRSIPTTLAPLFAASQRPDLNTSRTQAVQLRPEPLDLQLSRPPPSPSFDAPSPTILERFDLLMTSEQTTFLPTPSDPGTSSQTLGGATSAQNAGRMEPRRTPSVQADEPSVPRAVACLAEEISAIAKCGMCLQFLGTSAFVLECGHSFCVFCLRRYFESKIRKDLAPLSPHRYHHLHKEEECQTVPQSSSDKSVLIECLNEHGLRAEIVFQYHCPTCRDPVTVAPRPNVTLSQTLGAVVQAFGGHFRFEQLEPAMGLSNAQRPFDGLFLTPSELTDAHLHSYL
ncbi:hypothetical protein FA13DRAFT_1799026 [Coprinellus micaceus]|uniref:RING-type domain-containing protein n=1 Tax=Coprinellus micaceus TaxID=71717 RepID=A0A4Y7SLX4_COPMI|nr:hypothetical protein FA13DRAFT_1799026 [Coprinellus micaceus]